MGSTLVASEAIQGNPINTMENKEQKETKALAVVNTLPTLKELYSGKFKGTIALEKWNAYINQKPKKEWIRVHPIIKNYEYLPIDKVEFLLKKIFKRVKVQILREGTAFNGVYVVVRVHYLHPITGKMEWQDGMGAQELQTAKGKSPADMANIKSGALAIAFPIAESAAIKDAADHIGDIFGGNLMRKETMAYNFDWSLDEGEVERRTDELKVLLSIAKDKLSPTDLKAAQRIIDERETISYEKLKKQLSA